MDRSLTVLLPVHNAQSTLSQTVQEILDVLPELARRFDLLIIDDGSTDATSEVAQELVHHYPQVRAVYRGTEEGREAAIRTGLEQSRGEVVLVRDDEAGTPLHGLHLLWQPAGRQTIVRSQAAHGLAGSVRQRLERYNRREPGYRVVCQRGSAAVDSNAASVQSGLSAGKPSRPNYLARLKKFAFDE